MSSIQGKVISITGAASGIGRATAILFAERGALLSLADVQEQALKKVAEEIKAATPNAEVITAVVDVTSQKAVKAWIDQTVKTYGKLDGCANLAGVFKAQGENPSIENDDDSLWNFIIGINIMGVVNCLRSQIPHLGKGAAIVNAASILAKQGAPGAAAYCASKHGVLGLSRATAKDVGARGIRVNCFAPGYIDTPMLKASIEERGGKDTSKVGGMTSVALGRKGEPREVATLIGFLISDDSSFITGTCVSIDGGWDC